MKFKHLRVCDLGERLNFNTVREGAFDWYFVFAAELHQQDVDEIEHNQNNCFVNYHLVPVQQNWYHDQVKEEKDGFTRDDPPINKSARRNHEIKDAC